MSDVFSAGRGRLLIENFDIYSKFFCGERSKTIEHSIYERTEKSFFDKNKKTQKSKETKDN